MKKIKTKKMLIIMVFLGLLLFSLIVEAQVCPSVINCPACNSPCGWVLGSNPNVCKYHCNVCGRDWYFGK